MIRDVDFGINQVTAGYTDRFGGYSSNEYTSFNLALHVGDDEATVLKNRTLLSKHFGKIVWMNQTHSSDVVVCGPEFVDSNNDTVDADSIVTHLPNLALAVMTADCLPLLLSTEDATVIAACHCGWKGLAKGIVSKTIQQIRTMSQAKIKAFIGPCIRKKSFEVGIDVLEAFSKIYGNVGAYFLSKGTDKYFCDLSGLCVLDLYQHGIKDVTDCYFDTFAENDFYSYRRQQKTGRMASIIKIIR